MKLVLQQNQIGKFYFGSDEETLSFRLAFKDDNDEILRVGKDGLPLPEGSEEKGELAIFQMPSTDNPENASRWFKDLYDDADYQGLFDEHLSGHSGFTTGLDYPEQRVMFAYFIEKYYEEIYANAVEAEKKHDAELIKSYRESLRRLEDKTYGVADAQDTPNLFSSIVARFEKEVEKFTEYRDDYKEGNENWTKWNERVKKSKQTLARIRKIRKEAHNGQET